jgi:hypothetical protein
MEKDEVGCWFSVMAWVNLKESKNCRWRLISILAINGRFPN